MGRTGTLHAWQQDGVSPDIQIVGKCLGSGYAPISAILVNEKVIEGLKGGSGYFTHGQTYQSLPVSCAAALEVQHIVREEGLVENVARMGRYLESLLWERLGEHPHVGDIRGRGLFWCVEFVADKKTKNAFPLEYSIAKRMGNKGLEKGYDISLFAATGSADGWKGDHFLLAPPYIITSSDVEEIVARVVKVVDAVFHDLRREGLVSTAQITVDGKNAIVGITDVDLTHVMDNGNPDGPSVANDERLGGVPSGVEIGVNG